MEARVNTLASVLIVEDNRDAAESTAVVLRFSGYRVRVALSPGDALRLAAEAAPDVVLLDIGLPQMNGYELAHRLCEVLHERPVLVAITGYGHLDERSRAEGFEYHFLKPVDPAELERVLAECTQKSVAEAPVSAA
ncbi:MAG TPA: response regulator [Gemmataceae bacterium]|nr:response regulator [Gemmataceae bacterium]